MGERGAPVALGTCAGRGAAVGGGAACGAPAGPDVRRGGCGAGGGPAGSADERLPGAGSTIVVVRWFFCSATSRPFTDCNTQPEWSWPVLSRMTLLVA